MSVHTTNKRGLELLDLSLVLKFLRILDHCPVLWNLEINKQPKKSFKEKPVPKHHIRSEQSINIFKLLLVNRLEMENVESFDYSNPCKSVTY